MFKKLLFVVALLAVGAGSYGLARALFDNSRAPATSSASFTAGTINVSIETDGTNAVPFTLANWMPGQKQMVVFNVKNNSTVPVTLSGVVNGTWGTLGDHFVSVTKAEYNNGSVWAQMATTGHGTFTYADASTSSTLIEVPAGGAARIRMEASFDINATNEYQGETYTADLFVTATQVIPSL